MSWWWVRGRSRLRRVALLCSYYGSSAGSCEMRTCRGCPRGCPAGFEAVMLHERKGAGKGEMVLCSARSELSHGSQCIWRASGLFVVGCVPIGPVWHVCDKPSSQEHGEFRFGECGRAAIGYLGHDSVPRQTFSHSRPTRYSPRRGHGPRTRSNYQSYLQPVLGTDSPAALPPNFCQV